MSIFINKIIKFSKKITQPKYAIWILIVFTILINLINLQNFRLYQADELIIADTAFSIFEGSPLPKSTIWSHIFPEIGKINFTYPPLYFYFLGYFYKVFGFLPSSTGLFHLFIRLLSIIFLYKFLSRISQLILLNFIISLWWISYTPYVFYIGRPDDLAFLFIVISFYFLVNHKKSIRNQALSGIFLGLGFLTYPTSLIIGIPISFLYLYNANEFLIKNIVIIVLFAGITSLSWLFWIIPFFNEFIQYFLGFVVPDAGTNNFSNTIYLYLNKLLFPGEYLSFIKTFIPVLILLFASTLLLMKKIQASKLVVNIFSIIFVLLLISKNRVHVYAVGWLAFFILMTFIFILGKSSLYILTKSKTNFLIILNGLVLIQSLLIFGLYSVNYFGNIIFQKYCYPGNILLDLQMEFPKNSNVLTTNGLAFYSLREKNGIFWPSGIQGKTVGGVPYKSDYDKGYDFLLINEPISQIENLGGKFSWDETTREYFLFNYSYLKTIGNENCIITMPLSRFSTAPLPIFIYEK